MTQRLVTAAVIVASSAAIYTVAPGGAVLGLIFAAVVLVFWRERRTYRLQYDARRKSPQGAFNQVAESLAETFSAMTWGSCSTTQWRRRCEASLQASRRRRGLD